MAYLAGMRLSQGPPHDREILRIDIHLPAVDLPGADNHAVTVIFLLLHPELAALMGDEHLDFHETARIDQQLDPFPGSKLSALVLFVDLFLPAAQAHQRFLLS